MKTKYILSGLLASLCINTSNAKMIGDIECDSGTCISEYNCYDSIPGTADYGGSLRGAGLLCDAAGDGSSTCSCEFDGNTTEYPMYCEVSDNCYSGYVCDGHWECVLADDDTCPPGEWELFSEYDEGYQKRELQTYGKYGTCTPNGTYELRCNDGYWGTAEQPEDEDPTGCTMCPPFGGALANSTAGANTDITSCYMPANTQIKDETGTFIYTSDCFYSE